MCLITLAVGAEAGRRARPQAARATNRAGPAWVGRASLWMPSGVGLKIANLFGYRFEVARWDEMGPFVLVIAAVGSVVWASVLFCLVVSLRHVVASRVRSAAA